jgi:hypothetical protein
MINPPKEWDSQTFSSITITWSSSISFKYSLYLQNRLIIQLSVKYPKLSLKLGTNEDLGWTQYTVEKKQRTKLVFSPKLVLKWVSPLVLDLPNPSMPWLLLCFLH